VVVVVHVDGSGTVPLNYGRQRAYCPSPDVVLLWSQDGMILTGETEELGESPVPGPLCPPQIPHIVARARSEASAVTNRLNRGTA
jgi:hypothetical protein